MRQEFKGAPAVLLHEAGVLLDYKNSAGSWVARAYDHHRPTDFDVYSIRQGQPFTPDQAASVVEATRRICRRGLRMREHIAVLIVTALLFLGVVIALVQLAPPKVEKFRPVCEATRGRNVASADEGCVTDSECEAEHGVEV